ncbi:DNA helicase [Bertholletia excelsa]
MLMADDRSDTIPIESFPVDADDFDLSIDLQSLWDMLGETPNSEQNSSEDLSVANQQQGGLTSDVGNDRQSMHQMALPEYESSSAFDADIAGSFTFSPSYNSEVSDSRPGVSDGSFESAGNSVFIDNGKQDASGPIGSPLHSGSGSFTDWIIPAPVPDSLRASSIGFCQNISSCSRDSKENLYGITNSSTMFSFGFRGSSQLDSNHLNGENEFQFRCSEGDANSQYGSNNLFLEKFNSEKYCGSVDNGFNTSVRQDITEPAMINLDIGLPWDLHDSVNLQFMPNSNEMVTDTKDESVNLPPQNYGIKSEAGVIKVKGAVLEEIKTDDTDVNTHNIKCEVSNVRCPGGGSYFTRTGGGVIFDETFSQSLPCLPSDVPSRKQGVYMKDERNDDVIASKGMLSASFEDFNVTAGKAYHGFANEFDIDKCSQQLLPPVPPSNSSKKLLGHIKDETDGFMPSKRARYTLVNFEETDGKISNPLGEDHYPDVQLLEQPCTQLSTSTEEQLSCLRDPKESNLIQMKSTDAQRYYNGSRDHGSHIDDNDSDICILEDISEPARLNISSMNGKSLVTLQHSTHSDPFNHVGVGGLRHRANDERLIFRVVLQDLAQPKTEVSPPDGVLAVPLLRHQRIALSWMVQKEKAGYPCSGGILADDQGLGKTISTIALILKERAPSSRAFLDNLKPNKMETLNLDEDDDCGSEPDQSKQDAESFQVVSNGTSTKGCETSIQAKGRPAAGTLVVCPTSVLRQWADELRNKVTSKANLSVLVYHGSNRVKDPYELAKYDVVLTTYSIVSMEVPKQPLVDKDDDENGRQEACVVAPMGVSSSKKQKYPPSSGKSVKDKKGTNSALLESVARPLARVGWFRVVLDEAQSIKNHRTQVARACWGLRAKRRWCLSGTPIQNAVDDLYSYFRFLKYDPYAVYKSFCSTIKVPINRNPTNGYRKLQAVLKAIMLRRTKGTLLDGEPIITLPPKSVELRKVDFTKEERDFYCRLEADSRAQFAKYAAAGTVKQNYVNILLMLLRLRQACDHPLLVRGYDSSSVWRSTVEMAKKLPWEKQVCLLNCLEASLAICSICNDPPEDAVVTTCGHVFCNQCICEHLTSDDHQCPTINCKAQLSLSSVFSRAALKCSLSDLPGQDSASDCSASEVSDKLESGPWSDSFDSSKIKAALAVLQSLSKPSHCTSSTSLLKSGDDSVSCSENTPGPLSNGSGHNMLDNRDSDLDKCSSELIKVAGEKAIVFSQWTRMLDLLETCLKNSSIQYRRLDGTMSVVARDKAVKDFNNIPEVTVMIMSLKAASLGLNMVAACHVLLLDLWWNPTTEDQAVDRAHRIGQTRPVTVLRLTVKDTVEDRILALQQKKREMVASAFGEDETGSRQTRLTVEDLKYLFMSD